MRERVGSTFALIRMLRGSTKRKYVHLRCSNVRVSPSITLLLEGSSSREYTQEPNTVVKIEVRVFKGGCIFRKTVLLTGVEA
jgi:hypothetical protein